MIASDPNVAKVELIAKLERFLQVFHFHGTYT